MNSKELHNGGNFPEDNLIEKPTQETEFIQKFYSTENDDEIYSVEVFEFIEESEETEITVESDEIQLSEEISSVEESEDTEKSEEKTEKPKAKGNVIFSLLIAVFCLVIFGIGAANIILPDREYSDTESRNLAQLPKFTFFSLTEGTFTDDFETYLTDQFIFRDEIITLKTFFDRLFGKKESGQVYIGKDGYLFSYQSEFDKKQVSEITDALNDFADNYKKAKITFMLSPNSSYVNSDKLPDHLSLPDQNRQIKKIKKLIKSDNITVLNLCDTFSLSEDKENLFYKTDHHWTTSAAYASFLSLMVQWEKDISSTKFDFLPVADDFRGTLSSKSGVLSSADTVEICVPENSELTYVVTYDGQESKKATLFDESKLNEKNKYEVFLGGNFNMVTIDTTSESKDTLLIVKDSYANCMIPMFTPFFGKIVIVDPRYFTESLKDVADENDFTHMLFLYNLNTLLEDVDLADCLNK